METKSNIKAGRNGIDHILIIVILSKNSCPHENQDNQTISNHIAICWKVREVVLDRQKSRQRPLTWRGLLQRSLSQALHLEQFMNPSIAIKPLQSEEHSSNHYCWNEKEQGNSSKNHTFCKSFVIIFSLNTTKSPMAMAIFYYGTS